MDWSWYCMQFANSERDGRRTTDEAYRLARKRRCPESEKFVEAGCTRSQDLSGGCSLLHCVTEIGVIGRSFLGPLGRGK